MYFIYVMTNKLNTTLYIGMTNDIERRVHEHKTGNIRGFTQKYKLTKFVYFEEYKSVHEAIMREKQLKNWHREWKINLIKKRNPYLRDLEERDAEINSA